MNLYLLLFFMSFISGLIIYCSLNDHLLSSLLSLEYMVLSMFFLFMMSLSSNFYFGFMYLIMTACEGALGLSILVMMSRSHGGDYFKSFNLL